MSLFLCPNAVDSLQPISAPKYSSSTWWHHQMETFSALLTLFSGKSPLTGEFPSQRSVQRSSDVSFDLRLNKQTPPCLLWCHRNVPVNMVWYHWCYSKLHACMKLLQKNIYIYMAMLQILVTLHSLGTEKYLNHCGPGMPYCIIKCCNHWFISLTLGSIPLQNFNEYVKKFSHEIYLLHFF